MRVLQIGSDRSKRGILFPGSIAATRQEAYGVHFDRIDIIGFSVKRDGAKPFAASSKVHVHPTNSLLKLFYGLDTIRIVRSIATFDVISAQDPFEVGLLALLIARIWSVPLHVQVHTDFLAPSYVQHSLVNRMRVTVAGFILKHAARVRVVSERVKSEITERYHLLAPITVLPIFIDLERFRSSRLSLAAVERFKNFTTKLLIVSRLEPEKNVALAIGAFANGAPSSACLIIVGSGSERNKLETLAREKRVADRVFFEGEQDAAEYYQITDLVLVTSRYEGYGLVIIEALAAGKPVLSTDVGIARQVGALIASEQDFVQALTGWFEHGPTEMRLVDYPYKNFNEYVRKYCEDIELTSIGAAC
jgi:glycosyltransferase involved in cell wall biosynthesis